MNFEVLATHPFERKVKRLVKKHPSLVHDLAAVIDELSKNPTLGTPIGKDCYKLRIAIRSKLKGKSGGARMITYVLAVKRTVYLLDIYDKAEQATISTKELQQLINLLTKANSL